MIKKLNESMMFEEAYCLVLFLIGFTAWYFASSIGLILILLIATITLFFLKDFKYMIPCILFFIFSISSGFSMEEFPLPIIIVGFLFVFVLIISIIKKHLQHSISYKSIKSYGIGILSVLSLLPLLWNNIVPKDNAVVYFAYLGYLLYFFVYALFALQKEKSFRFLCTSFVYVALLISCECFVGIYRQSLLWPGENIFKFWYYLGWGLCNEAGIMMCVFLPFAFVGLIKKNNPFQIIISLCKIFIIILGMIMTTSRGTYLFGGIELVVLFILSLYYSNQRKLIFSFLISTFLVGLIFLQGIFGISRFFNSLRNAVFEFGFNDLGRKSLWKQAVEVWTKNAMTIVAGAGIVNKLGNGASFNGWDENIYIVYHSTIFQCLASLGIIGLLILAFHFFEKYRQLKKLDKPVFMVIGIGYLIVDIYGLIDNTYGMYYYMIPLMMVMAVLDNIEKEDIRKLSFDCELDLICFKEKKGKYDLF